MYLCPLAPVQEADVAMPESLEAKLRKEQSIGRLVNLGAKQLPEAPAQWRPMPPCNRPRLLCCEGVRGMFLRGEF